MQLDEPLREGETETGSLALVDARLGLLELFEDPFVIGGAIPGPLSATETRTSPLTCAALTSTAPPAGVNFTAFESRLKITCLIRRSSPSIRSTPESNPSATRTPSSLARSRTMTMPRSSASRSENGASSSSTWPASTFDRSRMSLISASRWSPAERTSSR